MIDELNIGLVSSRFNPQLCNNLMEGARAFFKQQKALINIKTLSVPGAYELPLGVQWLIEAGKKQNEPLDGVVALGVVIRGETPHFDYVAGPAAQGIMQVSLKHNLPVGFGLITANNYEQAANRASLAIMAEETDTKQEGRSKKSNKGYEAAEAVWAMILERRRQTEV